MTNELLIYKETIDKLRYQIRELDKTILNLKTENKRLKERIASMELQGRQQSFPLA